jgi:multiple sugar transport system permease protein
VYRQNIWGIAFALPAVALLLVFNIYPLMNALYLSFTKWSLAGDPEWVGLKNYVFMVTRDPEFFRSIKTTVYYAVGLNPILWASSLGLALLLNQKLRLRGLFRVIYFTPRVVSWVVASMVWITLMHPSFGVNAAFFRLLNRPGIDWLHDAKTVLPGMIVMSLWKYVGNYMILFLAGLQAIDPAHHEAAEVDGANSVQRFLYVTVPLLKPTIVLVIVISFISAFQVFTPIMIMTAGGPGGASRVFPLLIYENAMVYLKMGYASALAVVLFATLLVLTVTQMRLLRGGEVD